MPLRILMEFNRHKILFLSREGVAHPTALIEYLADRGFSSRSQDLYLLQGKVRRYFSSNAMISELRRTILEFSPDVIVFNDENSRAGLFAIMRANRKASKPIIWFRGAVGGYNALSPIDLYLLKHKNLARILVRSYAMINNWNASLTMRFLLSKTQVECSHHFVERTAPYDDDLSGMRAKWGLAPDDIVIGSIARVETH